jgi:hypothetical protein
MATNISENSAAKIDKWDIIDSIINIELEMFLDVKTRQEDGNAQCQEEPDTFKIMRWMSHSVLSVETLKSYLEDLIGAKIADRNLMTEKYALMENLIPHPKENPIITKIAVIELNWMNELKPKYPNMLQENSSTFKNYLICEYETYSDKTIDCLMADINTAIDKKLNLTELRYRNLFKRLGYKSLDDLDQRCKK